MDYINAIFRLQKIRKQVDETMLKQAENPFTANVLENCSLCLTMVIKDFVRLHKLTKKEKQNANNNKND